LVSARGARALGPRRPEPGRRGRLACFPPDDLVGELAQDDVGLLASGLDREPVLIVLGQEVIEEREVEQAPLVLRELVVDDRLAVDQEQRVIECLYDIDALDERDLVPAFDFGSLVLDAGLFLLHHFDRDAVAVVELKQLLLLGL